MDEPQQTPPDAALGRTDRPLEQPVLLFYDGYEEKAIPGPLGRLYSVTRGVARERWRSLRGLQTRTGFYTAFLGLKASLEAIGHRVRVNDFRAALANPDQPIGLCGFPSVIDRVRLPNPYVFGPGDYGADARARRVGADPKARILTQPSQWAVEYNRQWVGEKGAVYFAGIDTDDWPDASDRPKSFDVLVYDKIRWHRDTREHTVLKTCLDALEARGLTYTVLRYGDHHVSAFRRAVETSRTLLFLCEHETQGLAYQEAMSSGLPVLAWDEGVLVNPFELARAPAGLKVSSVPYFDARCGMTFTLPEFETTLDAFWAGRSSFRPRDYVTDTLSLEQSGRLYARLLGAAAAR